MINSIIGKYKISRLIGEGGMASVYEAEHELLGTKVAIKVLNPNLSSNAQIRERFINEAKLMASLNHPNITRVIDFDNQSEQLSIIMDLLTGEDLNERIKRKGALSEEEVTSVFIQTLAAFQYAHDKGIVHRDIKPSNIYILSDGTVKILDFGIAKLFGQSNEMTQTGTQMGTPIYMSPEQVRADKTIDHRSDIYSLGVTLYYALNGKPPYDSNTTSQFDIFNKIVYEPLPVSGIDTRWNAMIQKACVKDREQRFVSCQDWLKEMTAKATNRFSSDKTIIDHPVPNEPNKSNQEEAKTILQETISSNESQSTAKPLDKKTPPNFLKVLCIITFLGSGLEIFAIFDMFGDFSTIGVLILMLTFVGSMIGPVMMWQLNKRGYYVYVFMTLATNLSWISFNFGIIPPNYWLIYWFGFPEILAMFSPIAFMIMYAVNLKHMK
jgi:serine/threonine-protein kinase